VAGPAFRQGRSVIYMLVQTTTIAQGKKHGGERRTVVGVPMYKLKSRGKRGELKKNKRTGDWFAPSADAQGREDPESMAALALKKGGIRSKTGTSSAQFRRLVTGKGEPRDGVGGG